MPVTLPAVVAAVALVAVVALVALPARLAVIVPAVKFPLASRFTMVLAVFAFVAALARFAPAATFAAVTPPTGAATTVAPCVRVTFPASEPVKLAGAAAHIARERAAEGAAGDAAEGEAAGELRAAHRVVGELDAGDGPRQSAWPAPQSTPSHCRG